MHKSSRRGLGAGLTLLLSAPLLALDGEDDVVEAPIASTLAAMTEDVREYDSHVTTLSNPFMEGRLPGTYGMEVAKRYMQHYFSLSGLEPGFKNEDGSPSWRQPFNLGGTLTVTQQAFSVAGQPAFAAGRDFNPQSMGGSGTITAPLVFVGYSIDEGPEGYSSYAEGDSLKGKIAVMLRFEPMNQEGRSLWSQRAWSNRAGFNNKVRGAAERGAEGIIIVNTPGADDPRINNLNPVGSGRAFAPCPVLHMTANAGTRLFSAAGHDLLALRKQADEGRAVVELGTEASIDVKLENKPLVAENVGALLPGKGKLKDEIVVVGAHLDHLGMGAFGSRRGAGSLHPGADDNASGSAAILMIADDMKKQYDELPEGADARSVLFIGFSGEESGLNGSAHYANNPIAPVENHALMINFDMIGRITNKRLSVSGAASGKGMQEWVTPYFDNSPLDIVQPANMSGASDHTPFYNKGIPVLFGIIADFHGDYHTPDDVSWKINRVDAVHTIYLFTKIAMAASLRGERFEYQRIQRGGRGGARRPPAPAESEASSEGGVRLGISPAAEAVSGGGVKVSAVTDGGSAAEAGVKTDDVLTKWNGEKIANAEALVGFLSKCKPGEKVQLTLVRDGKETVLWVTL